jgi:hypothetical protein
MDMRPRRGSIRLDLPSLMLNASHLKIEPPQNTIVPITTWFHNWAKGVSSGDLKGAIEVCCI